MESIADVVEEFPIWMSMPDEDSGRLEPQVVAPELGLTPAAVPEHLGELAGPLLVWHERDRSHVENDVAGLELGGDIEGFDGHLHRPFAVERAVGGEFVSVGRVDHHLGG